MRIVFTSLFAFILSGFAGGLVAQLLAVESHAQEEYILVFMASALVTIVVTIVFFIAQLFSNASTIIDWLALRMPIIAGLVLPNLATVLVHWLFVRWRLRRGLVKAQVGA